MDNISIRGARVHNLKNIDVKIPLGIFLGITGVSGSGKSSLINRILAPYLANNLNNAKKTIGDHKEIKGADQLDKLILIDQSPIGRTPRSNPATYTGMMDEIRKLFAQTKEAELRGVAITNYGVAISKLHGLLDRVIKPFNL